MLANPIQSPTPLSREQWPASPPSQDLLSRDKDLISSLLIDRVNVGQAVVVVEDGKDNATHRTNCRHDADRVGSRLASPPGQRMGENVRLSRPNQPRGQYDSWDAGPAVGNSGSVVRMPSVASRYTPWETPQLITLLGGPCTELRELERRLPGSWSARGRSCTRRTTFGAQAAADAWFRRVRLSVRRWPRREASPRARPYHTSWSVM
jgi:hypothetical protein